MHHPRKSSSSQLVYVVATIALTLIAAVFMSVIALSRFGQLDRQPLPDSVDIRPVIGFPQPPDTYRFEPKPDITAYELAVSIEAMFNTVYFTKRTGDFIDLLPPSAQRHWVAPTVPAPTSEHEHDHQH